MIQIPQKGVLTMALRASGNGVTGEFIVSRAAGDMGNDDGGSPEIPADPYSLRRAQLEFERRGKEYPMDPDAVAKTTAFIKEGDKDYDEFFRAVRDEMLSDPSSFAAYHNALCRYDEVEAILAEEGLTPPV